MESAVSDGVQVRRGLVPSLVTVEISHDGSVHHQPLVGIDTDAEKTRVGVDLKHLVAGSQVVQNAGFVQHGQVGHVLFLWGGGGRVKGKDLLNGPMCLIDHLCDGSDPNDLET